jgi:hypothetical protein
VLLDYDASSHLMRISKMGCIDMNTDSTFWGQRPTRSGRIELESRLVERSGSNKSALSFWRMLWYVEQKKCGFLTVHHFLHHFKPATKCQTVTIKTVCSRFVDLDNKSKT